MIIQQLLDLPPLAAQPTEISRQSSIDERTRMNLKAMRRHVESGYPRRTKFASEAEVLEYVSQDSIDCLICGRRFRTLQSHITQIHRVNAAEYKARFGIPPKYGLTCVEYHEYATTRDDIRKLGYVMGGDHSKGPTVWTYETLEKIVEEVEKGARFKDLKEKDSDAGFYTQLHKFPELKSRYDKGIKQSLALRARNNAAKRKINNDLRVQNGEKRR